MYLIAQTGYHRGRSFEITSVPLVVGRDEDCEISIAGHSISRRHCELLADAEGPFVRDLGSRNGTFVNGESIGEARLKPGDEVAIGTLHFLVSDSPGEAPEYDSDTPTTTVTLSLSSAFYLRTDDGDPAENYQPRNIAEFRSLYLMGRRYSRAKSREDVIALLMADIQKHFNPEESWFAWYVGDNEPLVIHETVVDAGPAPEKVMREALRRSSGVLQPARMHSGGKRHFVTTIVAPLLYGDERVGVVACRTRFPKGAYDERDLQFFVAIGDEFAPFIRALERQEQLQRDLEHMRQRAGVQDRLIGRSQAMKKVRALIGRIAGTNINVLIQGETGTGKELVARMLHDLGARASHPFIAVNCAAVPRALFESEMFGHERGAFTGAARQHLGWFELAHGGTLFLDEIGDMPPEHQVSLLRALESGEFRRVGGEKLHHADVRIVAATHQDLLDGSKGRFRRDLYQRIAGMVMTLPPLREHPEDIPLLAQAFLEECAAHLSGPRHEIHRETIALLQAHPWPGNVRELRACIERSCALARSPIITPGDLLLGPANAPQSASAPFQARTMDEMQRDHIVHTLEALDGNISATAKALGISRAGLHKMLKRHGITG